MWSGSYSPSTTAVPQVRDDREVAGDDLADEPRELHDRRERLPHLLAADRAVQLPYDHGMRPQVGRTRQRFVAASFFRSALATSETNFLW